MTTSSRRAAGASLATACLLAGCHHATVHVASPRETTTLNSPVPSATPLPVPVGRSSPPRATPSSVRTSTAPAAPAPTHAPELSRRGVVIDAAGRPVAGVRVYAHHVAPDTSTFTLLATTSGQGRWSAPCASPSESQPGTNTLFFTIIDLDRRAEPVVGTQQDVGYVSAPSQRCTTSDVGRTTLPRGADITGTLRHNGTLVTDGSARIAVRCSDVPRGFVNAFQQIVNVPVDRSGSFRVQGLSSTTCDLGVATSSYDARAVRSGISTRAGTTTTADLDDGSPSPSPTPTHLIP